MGLNILVVDDSAIMRSMIKRTLQMSGVPVSAFYEAENGLLALDVLNEEWVDLVLLDMNMPVMGGLELIDRIRENPEFNGLHIIAISTESSTTRIEEIKKKGVEFIHKPFTPEDVRLVLVELIGDLQNADTGDDDGDSF